MVAFTPTTDSSASDNCDRMKLVYFTNELPSDDLHGQFRALHRNSKARTHAILAQFLDEATLAIRDEIRQLPTPLRALISPFESILTFAEFTDLRRQGPLCGSVEGVLLCTLELGNLIGYFEDHPHEYDFNTVETHLTGLGIGLLATAAVSLAPALADLPLAGAQVVRQAFRLGVLVDEVSQHLQPRDLAETGTPDSWAYVLPDATAAEVQLELDEIYAKEKPPQASRIFISAVSAASVTISGPPARLKALLRTADFFRDRRCVALPVYGGLCHAKHIYTSEHAHHIVRTPSMEALNSKSGHPQTPVYSTSTGLPFAANNATELFESIVSEILTQPIHWDRVVQTIIRQAQDKGTAHCDIVVFRASVPINDLSAALGKLPGVETRTTELAPWIHHEETASAKATGGPRGPLQSKIAIVGMSCRMPGGATDTEAFWDLLQKGLDVHRKVPADRFDVETHYDPAGKRMNASHTPYGCFIDEPGLFDAPFFNMSPREAEQTDPMQRLAIVTAYEALERAGYVPNRTAASDLHRVGTFYGQASDDYREVNTAQEISTYFIPGGCRAFGPGRINYFFKFSGPSYSIDTACSSSLATIQAACTSLWNGDTDMVVAGGMNVLTNSDAFAGLSHGHFLSKTPNACKTWDCEADGYCRADGVASIVMKRLEDAEADNDNILGVILAAATNHSAEAVSITHPHAGHQAYLGRLVINRAGIDPLDVSYVELHGTGTQAGDAEEIQSVTDVFAPTHPRRGPKRPLYIGSVKANVGHGEAAAGVTALVKVLLMLQKQAIPPHVGIKHSLNPKFPKDLDKRGVRIPYETTEWQRGSSGKKRTAVVNNFSAAGGNTTIVLEEAPDRDREDARGEADPRPTHVVAVSAKSKISLRGNIERLMAYLDKNSGSVSLADLSYTTTARRHHHNHRVAFAATDTSEVQKQLASALRSVDTHASISATGAPPIAFVFTGQGASYKSFHLELFHQAPYFRSQILHLDSLATSQGFPSFLPVLDGSHARDHAHSPVVTQLALVCIEMALAKYWATLGVRPDVVMGHSLGEYAALYVAGVLSASDTICLVGRRARLLEQNVRAGSHRMVAVRASLAQVEQSLAGSSSPYEVACVNGPRDVVLSGPVENMDAVVSVLEADGHKCVSLDVAFAFHSSQTDPILDDFEAVADRSVLFQPPQLPIISPLLNKVIFDERTVNANYMRRATRERVRFLEALETARRIGTIEDETAWIEIGPHPVCVGFVKAALSPVKVAVPSLRRGENSWKTMAESLAALHCAGVRIDWNEFHRPFEKALRLLDLPTYAWNDKTYWIQYRGDWALTKGNTFYDAEKGLTGSTGRGAAPPAKSGLSTTTVQRIVDESINGTAGAVIMESDMSQPDFRAAAWGHKMNECGVVTSSIHADISYTLGEYLYKKLNPGSKDVHVSILNLEVVKGLVANKTPNTPQVIRVSATMADVNSKTAQLRWHNTSGPNCTPDPDPFATATLSYGDAEEWLASWVPAAHLVLGRIRDLERLAESGIANRFSRSMAYLLFARNLVDYAPEYRGMQSVVMHGLEAFADVVLPTAGHGTWTVPPNFIDSVAHLAGFIMNTSDAVDTKNNFFVTPGWRSMRFARRLVPGARYRSYVKMIPTAEDPSVYLGDVYVLQGQGDEAVIVGMVGGIRFRQYPRILLNRFFSPPDATMPATETKTTVARHQAQTTTTAKETVLIPTTTVANVPKAATPRSPTEEPVVVNGVKPTEATASSAVSLDPESTTAKAIQIVALEGAFDPADLRDDTAFASLGVDSLMSLVIAEKFREQLGVSVNGSLFLEYPTVGDLKSWLQEYYN
ncbi:hypothetical protein C8A03DRAFT_38117 [Achaetomium macrosporum]|uniref:Polyketide synthase n=1 Tax=Achaetomium macrosporum TaxID=79813 RepID=A0AAN7C313_9PEZI|nr:hypothetical protein C8A03DRAFT_38117 [Achaetomium macrosporum]